MTEDDIRNEIERLLSSGWRPERAPSNSAVIATVNGYEILPVSIRWPADPLDEMLDAHSVPLSAAAFWIATKGRTHEADDGELIAAARTLLGLLTSGDIVAYGLDQSGRRLPVPSHEFFGATNFIPSDKEIDSLTDGVPRLVWSATLEADRCDRIERYFLPVWSHIEIERAVLMERWPWPAADIADQNESCGARSEAEKPVRKSDRIYWQAQEEKKNTRSRGRPANQKKRVMAAMQNDITNGFDPSKLSGPAMEKRYGANRATCRHALIETLPDNAKK